LKISFKVENKVRHTLQYIYCNCNDSELSLRIQVKHLTELNGDVLSTRLGFNKLWDEILAISESMAKCHTNLHHFQIKFGFVLGAILKFRLANNILKQPEFISVPMRSFSPSFIVLYLSPDTKHI